MLVPQTNTVDELGKSYFSGRAWENGQFSWVAQAFLRQKLLLSYPPPLGKILMVKLKMKQDFTLEHNADEEQWPTSPALKDKPLPQLIQFTTSVSIWKNFGYHVSKYVFGLNDKLFSSIHILLHCQVILGATISTHMIWSWALQLIQFHFKSISSLNFDLVPTFLC